MVRAYRWPRGVVSLLVVCMVSLGPFVQGVDGGLEVGIESVDLDVVEPPITIVQPDALELLSNIDGFFTENLGQKGEGEPILAREVEVPKKADESPGFEVLAVLDAMMLIILIEKRRG